MTDVATLENKHLIIFAKRLKQARLSSDFTQKELAELSGIAITHISHFENGRRMPNFSSLIKLVYALQISLNWLIGIKEKNIR